MDTTRARCIGGSEQRLCEKYAYQTKAKESGLCARDFNLRGLNCCTYLYSYIRECARPYRISARDFREVFVYLSTRINGIDFCNPRHRCMYVHLEVIMGLHRKSSRYGSMITARISMPYSNDHFFFPVQ